MTAIIVDGKKLTERIRDELKQQLEVFDTSPSFHIIYVGHDSVIDNFIRYKERFGEAIGVTVHIHRFPDDVKNEEIVSQIEKISNHADGIIIQLPLPEHLDAELLINTVPMGCDIDVLGKKARDNFRREHSFFLPPVTGAVMYILKEHNVSLIDKKILVVGNGTLVGYPMQLWLRREGYAFEFITKETDDVRAQELMKTADVIISGAGISHAITPEMIKEESVLIDAGTSESGKKIMGDFHPSCREKAQLFTPVPGGVGPLTIAILYQNIVKSFIEKR